MTYDDCKYTAICSVKLCGNKSFTVLTTAGYEVYPPCHAWAKGKFKIHNNTKIQNKWCDNIKEVFEYLQDNLDLENLLKLLRFKNKHDI